MEQLSKGIAKFVKFAKNEKFQNKPLDKFSPLHRNSREKVKNPFIQDMQRIFMEDIMGYEEVAKIIGEMEFYQSQLTDHEYLKNDLQKEKKILQEHRDILERQALESKKIYESICKKELASLTETLKLAKNRVKRAKITKETRLSNIDEQIARKEKEVDNFEKEILQILRKYGNLSINSTCLLLESLARLASQQVQGTTFSTSYRTIVGSLLAEIQPIIRNSIYGISSQELAEYSAGNAMLEFKRECNIKALEPGFNTKLKN
ncbi:unnamed protein product [Rhizophagus irregularis]|nr:unnamed protein product [Rhizophagus irregularis]